MTEIATHDPGSGFARSAPVLSGLTHRILLRIVRIPAVIVPTMIMPAFFIIAFTGSFDGISRVDGYPTDNIVNWVAAFAILQTAAFAGIGASSALATDLETRFIDRILVSPTRRLLIVLAPLGQAAVRSLIPVTVVLLIAWAKDASMPGGVLGVLMVYVGGVGTGIVMGALGMTVVLIIGNMRAMALVQMVAFVIMFPSTGQVPRELMDGWLADAAAVNPITPLLAMTRQGFLGTVSWSETWPGLLVLLIGTSLFVSTARALIGRLDD